MKTVIAHQHQNFQEPCPPHLQVLTGLNFLADDKHFLFSVNSLGKYLVLMFPLLCQFLQVQIT